MNPKTLAAVVAILKLKEPPGPTIILDKNATQLNNYVFL